MEYPALEKFINTMDLRVIIEISRKGHNKFSGKFVCCHILVTKDENVEYSQYHCYTLNKDGIKYVEGNQEIGVRDGIFAYLGDDKRVDNYFESKTRQLAKEYFGNK